MRTLQSRLLLVFLLIILAPILIGIIGVWMIDSASRTLDGNRKVFIDTAQQLENAGDFVGDVNAAVDRLGVVVRRVGDQHRDAVAALRGIGREVWPRLMFVMRVGAALGRIAEAERALLLSMTVRDHAHADQEEYRERQLERIERAFADIAAQQETYHELPPPDDKERELRDSFDAAYEVWRRNHETFMGHIGELERFLPAARRDDPRFAAAARQAYEAVFAPGARAQHDCEARLEDLYGHIAGQVRLNMERSAEMRRLSEEEMGQYQREAAGIGRKAGEISGQLRKIQRENRDALQAAAATIDRLDANFWRHIVLSVVLVLAAAGVVAHSARRLARPIRDMTRQIARLAQGDVDGDVPEIHLRRGDELGRFAHVTQDLIDATRAEIRVVDAMAAGDYTVTTPLRSPADQLGRALDVMVATTNQTLRQVNDAVEQMARGTDSVSAASQSLSQGAAESSQALEEISASIGNVDGQTRENADNAQAANSLANSTRDAIRRGYEAVQEMAAAMREIQDAGTQIANIAKLIDNIAFQTNLLALNASVEAARAGRHGRGFAVVADEVRNLAGRSTRAVNDTSAMIGSMMKRMDAGVELADRTDGELRRIVGSAEQVATLFSQITEASHQQSTAINQIALGLRQIDSVIRQNTGNAAQTAQAAEALSLQAAGLATLVERFRLKAHPDAAAAEGESGETPGAPEDDDFFSEHLARRLQMPDDGAGWPD